MASAPTIIQAVYGRTEGPGIVTDIVLTLPSNPTPGNTLAYITNGCYRGISGGYVGYVKDLNPVEWNKFTYSGSTYYNTSGGNSYGRADYRRIQAGDGRSWAYHVGQQGTIGEECLIQNLALLEVQGQPTIAYQGGLANTSINTAGTMTATWSPGNPGMELCLFCWSANTPPTGLTPAGYDTLHDYGDSYDSGYGQFWAALVHGSGSPPDMPITLDASWGEKPSYIGLSFGPVNLITMQVQSNPNPCHPGDPVTIRVVTKGESGTPTGTVDITDSLHGTLATGVALVSGEATITTSDLTAAGDHTITATYSGNGTYIGTSATTVQVGTGGLVTTMSIVSDNNPSVYGEPLTLTSTVSVQPVVIVQTARNWASGDITVSLAETPTVGNTLLAFGGCGLVDSGVPSFISLSGFNVLSGFANPVTHGASSFVATRVVQPGDGKDWTISKPVTATPGTSDFFILEIQGVPIIWGDTGASTGTSGSDYLFSTSGLPGTAGLGIGFFSSVNYVGAFSAWTPGGYAVPAWATEGDAAIVSGTVPSSAVGMAYGHDDARSFAAVQVSAGSGTPTGTIDLVDDKDGNLILKAPLSGGSYAYLTSALTVGTHNITSTYGGDGDYLPSARYLVQVVLARPPIEGLGGNLYVLDTDNYPPTNPDATSWTAKDDDYGRINSYYTTYFFFAHDLEQQPLIGSFRKLYNFLAMHVIGVGKVLVTPIVDALANRQRPLVKVALSLTDPGFDLEFHPIVKGNRVAFRIEPVPLADSDPSAAMGVTHLIVAGRKDLVFPIRGGVFST